MEDCAITPGNTIKRDAWKKTFICDYYDEDAIEQEFLRTKPTCFLVLGKPGSGKTSLASLIAEEWQCKLINAHQVISDVIAQDTELGKHALQILLRGEAIPEEMAIRMVEEKVNSPEVAHHGYVLDDIPCLNEQYLSIKEQLQLISSWKMRPDFIIHLRITDLDVQARRLGQKVDPVVGDIYTKNMYDPEKPKKEVKKVRKGDEGEEEEVEEEAVEEEDVGDEAKNKNVLPAEIIERLIKRPEDLPKHVGDQITRFGCEMLRLLEDFMSDHNQQKVFELDANKPPADLIKEVIHRLNCFLVRPAALPIRLNEAPIEEEPAIEELDTEELFHVLGGKHTVSARHRWRRSRWLRYCPVALYEGNLIPGKTEFSVAFLDKLYVLSSEEAMAKFLKNPRPYLMTPFPKAPCKLIVTGPPQSGKTLISKFLAAKYQAEVLNMNDLIQPRLAEEKEKLRESIRLEVTEKTSEAIKVRLLAEYKAKRAEEAEAKQLQLAEKAARFLEEQLAEEQEAEVDEEEVEVEEEEREEEEENSEGVDGLPKKTDSAPGSTVDLVDEPVEPVDEPVEPVDEPVEPAGLQEMIIKIQTIEHGPGDEIKITTEEPEPDPVFEVDENDPEILAKVEEAIEKAKLDKLELSPDIWIEELQKSIEKIEERRRQMSLNGALNGGWILDDYPKTKEHWTKLLEKNTVVPDEIIYLSDGSPDGDILTQHWYQCRRPFIDDMQRKRLTQKYLKKVIADRIAQEKLAAEWLAKETAEREAKEEAIRLEMEAYYAAQAAEIEANPNMTSQLQSAATKNEDVEDKEVGKKEDAVEEVNPSAEGTPEEIETEPVIDEEAQAALDLEKAQDMVTKYLAETTNLPAGPELDALKAERRQYDAEWANILALIKGNSTIETYSAEISEIPESVAESERGKSSSSEQGPTMPPIIITDQDAPPEIHAADTSAADKPVETPKPLGLRSDIDIAEDIIKQTERYFNFTAWERGDQDIEEEEGILDEDAVEEEEEEPKEEQSDEEVEEDSTRSLNVPLGDTNYFCPVVLKRKSVLWPGNPEISAKYREKVYYFSSDEAKEEFIADPLPFLDKEKPPLPPAPRLLILGPKGSGKSFYGRYLAKKFGLFHIQFQERLQELVIAKTKRRIAPEREEVDDEELPPLEDDEDEIEEAKIGDKLVEEQTGNDMAATSFQHLPSDFVMKIPKDEAEAEEAQAEETDVEEEEVAEVALTEDEEAIVAYLREDEPLPADFLQKLLEEWWSSEPLKSTGFILEGFPSTDEEAGMMAEFGLYPDAAIVLNVEDSEVIKRLFPDKMKNWIERRDKKREYRQLRKEKKKQKRERMMNKRRDELNLKKEEAKREWEEKLAKRKVTYEDEGDGEDDEDEEEIDIEAILAEEFEEEEEDEEEQEETAEDAEDRIKNEFMEGYESDTSKMAGVIEKLDELTIPHFEIDAGRKVAIVRYRINKRLKPFVEYRQSIFERVYPISEKLASKMIKVGYKQLSKYARWCPVKLSEGDCIPPISGFPMFPVIHRGLIYFLSSLQAREEFKQNPIKYLCQPSPKPVVPIRMSILGPPKSGKSTLAKRFASDYGLMRLSIGEAIRMVLEKQPHTELSRNINMYLYQGLTVPDECAVRCLEAMLLDVQCQTRGYILDGYPLTKIQIDLMEQRNIIPVRVIDLQVDGMELANRATLDRYSKDKVYPLHDSAEIYAVKLAMWQKHEKPVRAWYQNEHENLVPIPGDKSKWWVWNRALEIAKSSVQQIQEYLECINRGGAASIAGLCITPKEFKSRLGLYGEYCPIHLAKGELVDCSNQKSLKFSAEYRGYYYKMFSLTELEIFLKSPELYTPPIATFTLPTPERLPKRRTKAEAAAMFPKAVELRGYCPVTYLDGKQRYEALIAGNPELVVEYREKLYYAESEEKLNKFMRTPEKFWKLKLPSKLPPKKEPMMVTGLPMLGYMEQTVASAVTRALTAVGNFKPKYPFVSATRSALVYVALHLKAYNPNNTEYVRKKYKRKLQQFEEMCELISYLGTNMGRRYKEPKDRPIDFDFKIDKFFQLQRTASKETWVN